MKPAIYLDYMSTTPAYESVIQAMLNCLGSSGTYGNPGSGSHTYGIAAHQAIKKARLQVAHAVGASARDIIWTSGATESNNLAILGAARFYKSSGKHIISVQTEHKSVLKPLEFLQEEGFSITLLPVDLHGRVSLDDVKKAIRTDTILISVMHINNETGVIQDIESISKLAEQHGVLMHVDAAQSAGKVRINLSHLPVHLMSLSAHKNYGPKGVGALFVRQNPRVRLSPLVFGGGQEWGLRSGTLPTHQIVGMGEAFEQSELNFTDMEASVKNNAKIIREHLLLLDGVDLVGHNNLRYPGCFNLRIHDVLAKELIQSSPSVAISQGAACSATSHATSHVLLAMGLTRHQAQECIRLSCGRLTDNESLTLAVEQIKSTIEILRK
jgi:cysteine desulfurase